MNIRQINDELAITDFLAGQGFQPARKNGLDWWYVSPIRAPERTPSFKVNIRLNRWYDHGTGEGGKVFDLAMRLHRTASIREIIQLLASYSFSSPSTAFHSVRAQESFGHSKSPARETDSPTTIRVLEAKPLEAGSPLAAYLQHRGISIETANSYCHEVSFSIGERQYEAVGFANRSGGYELRNSWFKGSSSPKDITFIDKGTDTICLLEGFMDFLSLLELRPHLSHTSSFLVLNSLSQLGKSLEVLAQHKKVLLFLDQDQPGRRATERLLRSEPNSRDVSSFYRSHKDVNAYLMARKGRAKQLRLGLGHR
ncbi:Toprim-like [Pontibacter chinhatensis]|uniref:Toprim-like n=2 Tax=Pontibacter chinhatensis TaxID=1436961 RepID=A0A1I2QPW4_9BACT|nr:Toprim-like [Pontibacter chinhatensis]